MIGPTTVRLFHGTRELHTRPPPVAPMTLALEIALTPEQHRQGLAGRPTLAPNAGMLFVFPTPQHGAFWNAGTLVPLSLAYCDAAGTILDLHDMRSIGETGGIPERYPPRASYNLALEVPRGWFAQQGLRVGDSILRAP